MIYHITVSGTPVVTPRPRVLRSGITYTPKKAKIAQQRTAEEWRKKHKIRLSGPVEVTVYLFFTPPKSWTKKKQKAALEGTIYPTSHTCGDIDNLLKTVLDGLNGTAFVDDSQVVRVVVRMTYSTEARTEIAVRTL